MPSFNHVGFNEIMVMTTPPLWSPSYQVGSDGLDNSWQWGQGSKHPRGQGGTFLTHFSSLKNSSAMTILRWKTHSTDSTIQISNRTKNVTFCICQSVCHLLSSFSHVSNQNQKRSLFPWHCNIVRRKPWFEGTGKPSFYGYTCLTLPSTSMVVLVSTGRPSGSQGGQGVGLQ